MKMNDIHKLNFFFLQGPGSSTSTGAALVLHEVKKDDTGLYTCTARSSEGQSTDAVSVLILCKLYIF